jgi:RimJ/RimL family protein N-acetyltransferase
MIDSLSLPDPVVRSVGTTSSPEFVSTDWRCQLPVLAGRGVQLRELRRSDAGPLFATLTTQEVARFISPPPASVEGFERFIAWMLHQQLIGTNIGFVVTLSGSDSAIGLFQVRRLDATFETAEWGFALGRRFWGTGVFEEAARLALNFTFDMLGVHRLEARSAVQNGRGNGALLKLGAVAEGILRQSFRKSGQHLDQVLYSILAEDWKARAETVHPAARVQIH